MSVDIRLLDEEVLGRIVTSHRISTHDPAKAADAVFGERRAEGEISIPRIVDFDSPYLSSSSSSATSLASLAENHSTSPS